jgi:large conductance mechanosensitive channel
MVAMGARRRVPQIAVGRVWPMVAAAGNADPGGSSPPRGRHDRPLCDRATGGHTACLPPNPESRQMGLIKEFRDFAMRGNVIDLAVGVVIGGAFGKIISSLVANIIMPPLNLLTSKFGVNFTDLAWKIKTEAPKLNPDGTMVMEDGKPVMVFQNYPILNYGPFIQSVVDFLLVAAAIFLVVKAINTAKARFEEKKAEEPAAPPEDVALLREIRDALVKR